MSPTWTYDAVDSPLGTLYPGFRYDAGGFPALGSLSWGGPPAGWQGDCPVDRVLTALIQRTRAWLDAYFQRRWHVLDALPVVLAGTPFQQRVWQHMVTIPLATTCCYGDMARRLGTAPRAVGQAVAANPLPIVIPCHRVVGKAGLTGYSGYGGTGTKAWLLAHEAGEREPTMARS